MYFPGSLTGIETETKCYEVLHKYGFNDDNTLFADCSCPDEINHDDHDEDITALFQKRWGEIFPLSGLGGLPFTGKTGWAAFSGHVADDGNIILVFAPHVGIDGKGKVGSINRKGQSKSTSACGAAIGALANLRKDPTNGDFKNGYKDQQMDTIMHMLKPHVEEI